MDAGDGQEEIKGMNSNLTVATCRENFYRTVSASDPNSALFLQYLNQVCDRAVNSGMWVGSLLDVVFATASGHITLPTNMQSIVGVCIDKVPNVVFSEFHEYLETGPGFFDTEVNGDETFRRGYGPLYDCGDKRFCTVEDILVAGKLRLQLTSISDVGKVIRVEGKQVWTASPPDTEPIFDSIGNLGENITLANPFTDSVQTYERVTGVILPSNLIAPVILYVVNDGIERWLATYLPNETRPTYHRYKTGTITKPIRCLCRMRFIPLRAETDFVNPSNLGAIGLGLHALVMEKNGDFPKSGTMWEKMYQLLNDELKASLGKTTTCFNIWNWGVGQPSIGNAY